MANFLISSHDSELVKMGTEYGVIINFNGQELPVTLLCNEVRYVAPEGVYFPEGFCMTRLPHYEYHFLSIGEFL